MLHKESETERQVKFKQAELSTPGNPCDETTALYHVIDDRWNALLAALKHAQSSIHRLETRGDQE